MHSAHPLQMWNPYAHTAKRAATGNAGGRLRPQPGASTAGGGDGFAEYAARTANASQAQVWQAQQDWTRQPAAPPGSWQRQPKSWPAVGGSWRASQKPAWEANYYDSSASFQSEDSTFEAFISQENGSGALQQSSSAGPPGLYLDRFNACDGAASVDFSERDPFLSESCRGKYAFSLEVASAIASADNALGWPRGDPDCNDPDCNVSFFPDLESCCMSGGGREFRVGIALPELQEMHVAVDAVVAMPQPVTAEAYASAQGDTPGEDLAPPSAVALLDPDARGGRPPTTMVMRNVPKRATKQELLDELDRSGFAGAYDFAYLPRDFKSHLGKGHAFVNFLEPEAAAAFAAAWHRRFRFGSTAGEDIPLNVAPASLQGYQPNVDKWTFYRRGRVKNPGFLPFMLHG